MSTATDILNAAKTAEQFAADLVETHPELVPVFRALYESVRAGRISSALLVELAKAGITEALIAKSDAEMKEELAK